MKKMKVFQAIGLACALMFTGEMKAAKIEIFYPSSQVVINDNDKNYGEISKRNKAAVALANFMTCGLSTILTNEKPATKTIIASFGGITGILATLFFGKKTLRGVLNIEYIEHKNDAWVTVDLVSHLLALCGLVGNIYNTGEILLGKTNDKYGKPIKNWS